MLMCIAVLWQGINSVERAIIKKTVENGKETFDLLVEGYVSLGRLSEFFIHLFPFIGSRIMMKICYYYVWILSLFSIHSSFH